MIISCHSNVLEGSSTSWLYGSWIYNCLLNQCLSPLTLWVRIPFMRGVLDTTLCDKVCLRLTEDQWFSPDTPVSSINKTDRHDITEILLKVALNTINQPSQTKWIRWSCNHLIITRRLNYTNLIIWYKEQLRLGLKIMVFHATFNNMLVMSWLSIL